jgi:hypothetical protein
VGEEPFWAEGLDLLGRFGFPLVVVPHWNNAEGGTFDTRFCFMGEPRFRRLEDLIPEGVGFLGIDEHTACILDFQKNEAGVRGIGTVTLRRDGAETVFQKGDRFPLEILQEGSLKGTAGPKPAEETSSPPIDRDGPAGRETFWNRIHEIQRIFQQGMEQQDFKSATNALLELDRSVWEAQQDLEAPETISQARELFRELIVQFGMQLEPSSPDPEEVMAPLVRELLERRASLRGEGRWEEADDLRETLHRSGVFVEDTPEGARWRLTGR